MFKSKLLKIGGAITGVGLLPMLAFADTTQDAINASSTAIIDQTGAIFFSVVLSVGLTLVKWLLPIGLALLGYHYFRSKAGGRV